MINKKLTVTLNKCLTIIRNSPNNSILLDFSLIIVNGDRVQNNVYFFFYGSISLIGKAAVLRNLSASRETLNVEPP